MPLPSNAPPAVRANASDRAKGSSVLQRRIGGGVKTPLSEGLHAIRPVIKTIILFSLFINVLMFVSPLYMLQLYDRVLSSRSEGTLISLTVIAAALLAVYGLLEMVRTKVLVRAGILFDEKVAQPAFNAIHG